ncbi:hypothetical protein [Zavarzinella formosa]|uniref:hypothetical protein n=1 Tax=Zavarzinella formosa TaxID=360055 RepID=UPI00037C3FFA|nr:hypothetical protein [Zavarzinella formosa]
MSVAATEPVFEASLPEPLPLSKGERERNAFFRLLPELLATHLGQYVAIHDEKVADSDADDIALVRRVHAKVGYVPIHVALVEPVRPLVRIPHFRIVRPAGE